MRIPRVGRRGVIFSRMDTAWVGMVNRKPRLKRMNIMSDFGITSRNRFEDALKRRQSQFHAKAFVNGNARG